MINWIKPLTITEIYRQSMSSLAPGRVALIYKGQKITLGEIKQNIERMMWGLQEAGVRAGMHVAYSLADSPEVFYLVLALIELGACIVPLHSMIPVPAKVGILQGCQVEFFVTGPEAADAIEMQIKQSQYSCPVLMPAPLMEKEPPGSLVTRSPDPGELVMLISSSGTTGRPKFVEINQGNFASVVKTVASLMRPLETLKKPLTCQYAFPLTSSGIMTITAQILFGVTIVILDDYSPLHFLSLVETCRPDAIGGTPGYLQSLISLSVLGNYDLTSVKRVYSGMDVLSVRLVVGLREKLPGVKIVSSGFGLAETTTVVLDWHAAKEDDYLVPATHLQLLSGAGNEADVQNEKGESCGIGVTGELMLRGPSVIKRYYRNPGETEKAITSEGWLHTGDIACKEPDGRIQLLGRKKYIIKRGGYSISPLVIQAVLLKLSQIAEAAVVGVPHPLYGQMIWVYIQTKKESVLNTGSVLSHCRSELPAYMVPDQVTFLEAIPRTPGIGKVDQEILIKMGEKELEKISGGQYES